MGDQIDDLESQTEECHLRSTDVKKAQKQADDEISSLQRKQELIQSEVDNVNADREALQDKFSLSEGQSIGSLSDHFHGSNFAMLAPVALAVVLLAMFAKRSCRNRRRADTALTGSEIQARDDEEGGEDE